jgi:hypothetical protein
LKRQKALVRPDQCHVVTFVGSNDGIGLSENIQRPANVQGLNALKDQHAYRFHLALPFTKTGFRLRQLRLAAYLVRNYKH